MHFVRELSLCSDVLTSFSIREASFWASFYFATGNSLLQSHCVGYLLFIYLFFVGRFNRVGNIALESFFFASVALEKSSFFFFETQKKIITIRVTEFDSSSSYSFFF